MTQRITIIAPGDVITAARQNQIAKVINDLRSAAPTDGDGGIEDPPPGIDADVEPLFQTIFAEIRRDNETVRIFQDGDTESDNYVDVERAVRSLLFNVRTGNGQIIDWI